MASKDPAESIGEGVGLLLQIIFNCTTPLVVLTLPVASGGLMLACHAPEFGLWPGLAILAFNFATANLCAAIIGGVLIVAAVPLAWVAFKEREIRLSKAILEWVITTLVLWLTFWLRTVWTYDASGWQFLTYGVLLLTAWSGVIEASLSTLAIVAIHRANRPVKARPSLQQPHGTSEQRPAGGEPETI